MAALLTSGEAAKYLGISVVTLRRWTRGNCIPVYRDPDTGRCRYAAAALDRWLADNCPAMP